MDQYASDAPTADFQNYYDEPPKTSVLAILSLVCSLICFIPGLSAIGALLGVFALIRIVSSNGRIRGTGLAVAGIAIGVVVSLLWIGGAIAVQQGTKQYFKFAEVMSDIESDSYDSARGLLAQDSRPLATDEVFREFKAAYEADAGSYAGQPGGLMEMGRIFGELGSQQDPNQLRDRPYGQSQIPLPGKFQNGSRWIFVGLHEGEMNASGSFPAIDNVGVWLSDDTLVWLIDPDELEAATGIGSGSDADTDVDTDDADDALPPAGDIPADDAPTDNVDTDETDSPEEGEG